VNEEERMKNAVVTVVLLSALALVACGGGPTPAPVPAPDAAMHAAEGVVPGSYEDWCGEHQVPESQCTRCNPALVAAFQATGDWCAEHGLPESQCSICNPDLKIERPPKRAGTP
jgi:hypothetical protein